MFSSECARVSACTHDICKNTNIYRRQWSIRATMGVLFMSIRVEMAYFTLCTLMHDDTSSAGSRGGGLCCVDPHSG